MQHGVKGLCYMTQTIEDINISSPAFLIALRGVAQLTWWLNLPHSPLQITSAPLSYDYSAESTLQKLGVLNLTPVSVVRGPHPQVLKLHPRV